MLKNLITVSFTATIIAAMLLIYNYNTQSTATVYKNELIKEAKGNTKITSENKVPRYIIKVLDGYLAVYVPSSSQPIQLTDIDMRTLRLNDQKIMAKGFPIYSEEQLCSFLEDFGS